MVIGIDGNEANVAKKVGISEYAFELLSQFASAKLKMQNLKFFVYLKNKPRPELPTESDQLEYRIVKPSPLWTQIGLPIDLRLHKPHPDVFFTPTHYAPRFSPVPTAIAIMDVSYLHFPFLFKKRDLYQLKHWTAYSAKQAKRIFTISESSKRDIIKAYAVEPDSVLVTYPGLRELMKTPIKQDQQTKNTLPFDLTKEYILFVGTLQPRKNIERLIEAYSLMKSNKKEKPQLIIVGKKGWLYETILQAPKKYHVEQNVIFLEFVTDEQLKGLYHHAQFFILPSLYEGFGLPILEAMAQGCPVITSNVSSMPEAGGDAALYINPEDTKDITQAMERLMIDNDLRKELQRKGYEHVKKFSWEKTAKETLRVLESIVQKNKL